MRRRIIDKAELDTLTIKLLNEKESFAIWYVYTSLLVSADSDGVVEMNSYDTTQLKFFVENGCPGVEYESVLEKLVEYEYIFVKNGFIVLRNFFKFNVFDGTKYSKPKSTILSGFYVDSSTKKYETGETKYEIENIIDNSKSGLIACDVEFLLNKIGLTLKSYVVANALERKLAKAKSVDFAVICLARAIVKSYIDSKTAFSNILKKYEEIVKSDKDFLELDEKVVEILESRK